MLIETVFTTATTFLIFVGLCSVSYYALSKEYSRYIGQEALMCMLEIDDPRQCEHESQPRLHLALQLTGSPTIILSGKGRKRKIAHLRYRPYKQATLVEAVKQSLSIKEVIGR